MVCAGCAMATDEVYIKDVLLVTGKNPTVPEGYFLIDTDLNSDNFFGRSIYLCYSTTTERTNAINALQVIAGSSSNLTVPTGYTKLEQDLNENAGGSYVYLCKLKEGTAELPVLAGLTVVTGFTRHTYPHDPLYIRINQDCNEWAGKTYVYICYMLARPLETTTEEEEEPEVTPNIAS